MTLPTTRATRAMDDQQQRFNWISIAAIAVSFVHMAAALVLFSREGHYIEQAAAVLMTALIDVATWGLSGYLDYARTRKRRSHWAVALLFSVALIISMFLNGAYLYANRPAEADLPEWISIGIAITFAVFVPCLIGVAALIRGEVDADKLALITRNRPREYRLLIRRLAQQVRKFRADHVEATQLHAALLAMEATAATFRESAANGTQASQAAESQAREQLATIARLETQLQERERVSRESSANQDTNTRELREQLAEAQRIARESTANAAQREQQSREQAAIAANAVTELREAQRLARERDAAARAAEMQARDLTASIEHLRATLRERPPNVVPSRALIVAYVREQMSQHGRSLNEVAKELGFTESTVRGWVNSTANGHTVEIVS